MRNPLHSASARGLDGKECFALTASTSSIHGGATQDGAGCPFPCGTEDQTSHRLEQVTAHPAIYGQNDARDVASPR